MDLAIVTPHLAFMSGSVRLVLECIEHWKKNNAVTLYTSIFDKTLFEEYGHTDIKIVTLLSYLEVKDYIKDPQYLHFFDNIVFPRYWNLQIGRHEIYNFHFFPANLVQRRPAVWYPHEPFRLSNDLRYELNHPWVPNIYTQKPDIPANFDHLNLTQSHRDILFNSLTEVSPDSKIDTIVANSKFTAMNLEAAYGVRVDDIVYPGTRVPDKIKEPSDENIILTIANLEWHKRTDLLLQAMRFIPDGQLVIIGYSNEEHDKQFEYLVRTWNVADRVKFIRLASEDTLHEYLNRALCFAFLPIKEPFGIAPMEAMAAGKPIIAPLEGGFLEVLTEDAAFFVEPSPFRIAEAVNKLINNRELAIQMGKKARSLAEKFTWEKTAKELENIFRRTIDDYNKRTAAGKKVAEGCLSGAVYKLDYTSRDPEEYADGTTSSNMPLLGYYDSSRGYIMEKHLKWAEEAGLDFLLLHVDSDLILNETSVYPLLYLNIIRFMDIIEHRKYNMKVSMLIEVKKADAHKYDYLLALLYQSFMLRECFLEADGLPAVWLKPHTGDMPPADSLHAKMLRFKFPEPDRTFNTDLRENNKRIAVYNINSTGSIKDENKNIEAFLKEAARGRRPDLILINSFNDFSVFHMEPDIANGNKNINLLTQYLPRATSRNA